MPGIDSLVGDRAATYAQNPQALMQRYTQSQDLLDLLALQKMKSDKEAAMRDMQLQMQPQPTSIKDQREQEVFDMTKAEVTQQVAPGLGIMGQRMAAARTQPQPQQAGGGGIATLPAANMQGMASGGIVTFADGGDEGLASGGIFDGVLSTAKKAAGAMFGKPPAYEEVGLLSQVLANKLARLKKQRVLSEEEYSTAQQVIDGGADNNSSKVNALLDMNNFLDDLAGGTSTPNMASGGIVTFADGGSPRMRTAKALQEARDADKPTTREEELAALVERVVAEREGGAPAENEALAAYRDGPSRREKIASALGSAGRFLGLGGMQVLSPEEIPLTPAQGLDKLNPYFTPGTKPEDLGGGIRDLAPAPTVPGVPNMQPQPNPLPREGIAALQPAKPTPGQWLQNQAKPVAAPAPEAKPGMDMDKLISFLLGAGASGGTNFGATMTGGGVGVQRNNERNQAMAREDAQLEKADIRANRELDISADRNTVAREQMALTYDADLATEQTRMAIAELERTGDLRLKPGEIDDIVQKWSENEELLLRQKLEEEMVKRGGKRALENPDNVALIDKKVAAARMAFLKQRATEVANAYGRSSSEGSPYSAEEDSYIDSFL